mmetsp:Transcript_16610/g.51968  ORF Transcript_16610/g.51968 Transcript_16610/m.51968 type:complete len:217 (+) Transcript_16610:184-834(+)
MFASPSRRISCTSTGTCRSASSLAPWRPAAQATPRCVLRMRPRVSPRPCLTAPLASARPRSAPTPRGRWSSAGSATTWARYARARRQCPSTHGRLPTGRGYCQAWSLGLPSCGRCREASVAMACASLGRHATRAACLRVAAATGACASGRVSCAPPRARHARQFAAMASWPAGSSATMAAWQTATAAPPHAMWRPSVPRRLALRSSAACPARVALG